MRPPTADHDRRADRAVREVQRDADADLHLVELPDEAFQYGVVAAGVVTLLVALLSVNSIAILIRNKYQTEDST